MLIITKYNGSRKPHNKSIQQVLVAQFERAVQVRIVQVNWLAAATVIEVASQMTDCLA